MELLRIREAQASQPFRLRLVLTNDLAVERDVEDLLVGPVFDAVRRDRETFRQAAAANGTVCWPNGADLCPDVLIWGGSPPKDSAEPPTDLRPWLLDATKR